MNRQYELIKLDNKSYDFLVIAFSPINPLSYLEDILNQIEEKNFNILFDLTLINGVNDNRYIKGKCVEGIFLSSSFTAISSVDKNIKNICKSFFVYNNEIVQKSVIPNQLKFLIKQGMV